MNKTSEMLIKIAMILEYHAEKNDINQELKEFQHIKKLYKNLNEYDFDLDLSELALMSVSEVAEFTNTRIMLQIFANTK